MHKRQIRSFFSILFVLLNTQAFAQDSFKVFGKVIDENSKPLEFASVLLLSAQDSSLVKGALVDAAGDYEFLNIPPGRYLVVGAMMGYKKAYSSLFTLDPGNAVSQLPALVLAEDAQVLGEVVVQGERPAIERKLDRIILNVQNSALAGGGTAVEILEKAPGVSIDRDGNLTIKGKQGVILMVDGKPAHLSAGDLQAILKNMPANSIDQVEIITNPSAKYDAAGNAGIINIITNKHKEFGINGTSTAGWEWGRFHKYHAGLELNYRNKRFNLFGNYHYSHRRNFSSMDVDRRISLDNATTSFDQFTYYERDPRNHSYKLGLDYFAGPNDVIGLLVTGFNNEESQRIRNNTFIRQSNRENDATLLLNNRLDSHWRNQAYNLNYKKNISAGRELTVDLDYSLFLSNKRDKLNSQYYDYLGVETGSPFLLSSNIPSRVEIKSLKADYVHALAENAKLELGAKSSFVSSDNQMQFSFNQNLIHYLEEWNHFKFSENVNAAYLNYHRELKALRFQLGLRAEQTNTEGHSVSSDKVVDTLYLQWFPSLFVAKKLNEKHELNFSYSRRIDRPNYHTLNPFVYFLDLYTNFQGNPYLRPQNTHSIELSHNLNSSFHTTLGFSHTSNALTIVIEQNDAEKVSSGRWVNLDQLRNYSLTFSKFFDFTKWWTASNNLNCYYNHYKGEYLEMPLDNRSFTPTFKTALSSR